MLQKHPRCCESKYFLILLSLYIVLLNDTGRALSLSGEVLYTLDQLAGTSHKEVYQSFAIVAARCIMKFTALQLPFQDSFVKM